MSVASTEKGSDGARHAYTMASTPLQYLSHIDRNLGCPECRTVSWYFIAPINKNGEHSLQILTCDIPNLHSDIALPDFTQIKGNSWDNNLNPLK